MDNRFCFPMLHLVNNSQCQAFLLTLTKYRIADKYRKSLYTQSRDCQFMARGLYLGHWITIRLPEVGGGKHNPYCCQPYCGHNHWPLQSCHCSCSTSFTGSSLWGAQFPWSNSGPGHGVSLTPLIRGNIVTPCFLAFFGYISAKREGQWSKST